ncbi:MAG: gamma-glutamyltransferase [Calditrichaeota bacterium]|nr:gamma-glutamyltransferase [Calditrichota bacterium]MCB9391818.1 gamma-glutamyltransferase [Calditrichota bacterium]
MSLFRASLLSILWVCAVAVSAATRSPSYAPNVMIASADTHATRAGLHILEQGGNAADAAVAVALALGVSEGYSSGLGGGCFILVRMADGRAAAIDGREVAPHRASRLMFVPVNESDRTDLSLYSPLAAGVPGQVAGLELLASSFGTLPFEYLVEPAAALADTGFVLNDYYADALRYYADRLAADPGSAEVYFNELGAPFARGERFKQPDLAATLRRLQSHGAREFYTGETATRLCDFMRDHGGLIDEQDLANYRAKQLEPLRGSYRGFEVLTMPPPSSGGAHLLQMLNILEGYSLSPYGPGSSAFLHLCAEAMTLAFADRAEYLGDPAFTPVPVRALTDKAYAEHLRSTISTDAHQAQPSPGPAWDYESRLEHHTTHFCVVDAMGNAVSLTATVNTPFATGITVPGTGILLNNEMDDFVTEPGKPNYFGLIGKAVNEIEPGKKPLSSMTPTIVTYSDKPYLLAGGAGGPRIITATLLTLVNSMDHGLTIQQAVDWPRIHAQWMPDRLYVEPEHPADVQDGLLERGHILDIGPAKSRVQAVVADTVRGGWLGAADSRGAGAAIGF